MFVSMAQVLVRNLAEEVVEALKRKAELRGRSLEQELREILAAAATQPCAERLAMADRVRALGSEGAASDSTELIREDRDNR